MFVEHDGRKVLATEVAAKKAMESQKKNKSESAAMRTPPQVAVPRAQAAADRALDTAKTLQRMEQARQSSRERRAERKATRAARKAPKEPVVTEPAASPAPEDVSDETTAAPATPSVVDLPEGSKVETVGAVTKYQPQGDPFTYEYDASTQSFSAFTLDGTPVVTGVTEGDPAYAEFLEHAKGGRTRYYGGGSAASKAPAAEAPAAEVEAESTVDEFGNVNYGESSVEDEVSMPEGPVGDLIDSEENVSADAPTAPAPQPAPQAPSSPREAYSSAGYKARQQSPFLTPDLFRIREGLDTYMSAGAPLVKAVAAPVVRDVARAAARTVGTRQFTGRGDRVDQDLARAMGPSTKDAYQRAEDKEEFLRRIKEDVAPTASIDELRRLYEGDLLGEREPSESVEDAAAVEVPGESSPVEAAPAPEASPTPKEMREKAASAAINREEQLAEFRRTATDEQKQDLKRAQAAYGLGMRAGTIRQVRAAMQKAADAEGSGYQVKDDDAIYLLENY